MQGVIIKPVIAIDDALSLTNREAAREELRSRVIQGIEGDRRFMAAKASIEESGYIDDYERHGVTFHMVVDEDGMQLHRAASSQNFLDPALLDEDYMPQQEYANHVEKLRELAAEVAADINTDDVL